MQNARDVLNPDALAMLQVTAESGSFAAAAQQLWLAPCALTYYVRHIEDALDVLVRRQCPAGSPHEGGRPAVARDRAAAHRVRRVAASRERQRTISVCGLISPHSMTPSSKYGDFVQCRLTHPSEMFGGLYAEDPDGGRFQSNFSYRERGVPTHKK